ncbi:MAG: hypothetical protein IT306_13215 [Chloroflexi bacterium]|nr:hypothetical protein [Chloroflexota bacterium]
MDEIRDPLLLERPYPPTTPRDPNADTVLDESERGQDEVRGDAVDSLMAEPARPLTHDEKEAAEHEASAPGRVFAPAAARVPKPPAPGDDRLIAEGLEKEIPGDPLDHPGDRSDPSELR